jgi:hypothetical protein
MPADPVEIENAQRKQRYDAYIKERDGLRNDSLTVSERYDRAILLLGGGALALSLTFLEKIAPHPIPISFVVLGIAWLGLIASILLQLHALSTSQTVTNDEMEIADREYRDYLVAIGDLQPVAEQIPLTVARADVEERKTTTRRLNVWSRWLLTLSIFLLCVFSLVNLPFVDGRLSNRNHLQPARQASSYRYKEEIFDFMANKPINESKGSYIPPKNALPPPSLAKPAAPAQAPAQPAATPPAPAPPAAPPQNP